ncbi:MAG: hypothetical protein JXR65_08200 [Bacteroidales bacterium]|nr:hypothetical protein [Bacteroidales bacterium]
MKWKKIVIWLLIVLVVSGISFFYLTRNDWMQYYLKKEIYTRTNGRATLNFDRINLNIFKKRLTVYHPSIEFKGITLDKKTGLMLQKSDFKELKVYNLSLLELLKSGEYFIKDLTVSNPSFYLGTQDSLIEINNKESFDPIEIIHLLLTKRLPELPFRFHIQQTNILNGTIKLIQKNDTSSYGSAQYNIRIKNLESLTTENNNGLVPLHFEDLIIDIYNLNRYSNNNKYRLKIDSIEYNSKGHHLLLNGLHYQTSSGSKSKISPIELNLEKIILSGMASDTTQKNLFLNFHNLEASGGNIVYEVREPSVKRVSETESFLDNAFKHFKAIKLDQLNLSDLEITLFNRKHDTLLNTENANLSINQIVFSKNDPYKILSHFEYGNLILHSYKTKLYDKGSDNRIRSEVIEYNSKNNLLSLKNAYWENNCFGNNQLDIKLETPQFQVQNFNIKKFLKNIKQSVTFVLEEPHVQVLSSEQFCSKGFDINSQINPLIVPEKLIVLKGVFSFKNHYNELSVNNINGQINHLNEIVSTPDFYTQDTLIFKVGSVSFHNSKNSLKINARDLKLDNNNLITGSFQFSDSTTQNILVTKKLIINHINIQQLVRHKEVIAQGLNLSEPVLSINYHFNLNNLHEKPEKITFLNRVNIHFLNFEKGKINFSDSAQKLHLYSDINLYLKDLVWHHDSGFILNNIKNVDLILSHSEFKKSDLHGNLDSLLYNEVSKRLNILQLKVNNKQKGFSLSVPKLALSEVNLLRAISEKHLHFSKITIDQPNITARISHNGYNYKKLLKLLNLRFDSLQVIRGDFKISTVAKNDFLVFHGNNLNAKYQHLNDTLESLDKNLVKKWQFSLQKLTMSETSGRFHAIADQIQLQSEKDRISIDYVSESNVPKDIDPDNKGKLFTDFKLRNISWKGLNITYTNALNIFVKEWKVDSAWVKLVHNNNNTNKPKNLSSLIFPEKNNIFRSVHIDTTLFDNVDVVYSYDQQSKQITFPSERISIGNINIDSTLNSDGNLFERMLIDTHGKSIVSGDSMYVFKTKDIRINLPRKSITLDSITLLPTYPRKQFFKILNKQSNRISIYGKSIDILNFDLPSLLNNKLIKAGNLKFNNLNILLERDKRLPADTTTKLMPLELLKKIPYHFKLDSVELNQSLVSYYEYEKKSLLPGIFFIDNFNTYFLNVSNDLQLLDSNAVLKINGNGNLMRETPLNFVLVMPYFAKHDQFWFSAQTQWADLTQFNSLLENIVGISIKKGTARADVQYVSGNNEVAKGNMLFEYKNLKIRLFNRRKAVMNKSLGSPFVNFMLNRLMIRSSNPKFLKPPRKGIVYYERDPQKSFINYIWKSSLSGILSTLGFNNKEQRQEKKTIKQSIKKSKKQINPKNEH